MSQGSWGGGGGMGGGGGWPTGGGGGYGPPPGGGGGGYGPPPGGSGGFGPPPGGGYGPPPGGGGGFGPGGFAPPPAGFPPGYSPPGASGGPMGPVPWEDSSLPFFTRWWLTTREAMFNPRTFFRAASQSDDPWPSITFGVTSAAMAGLVLGIIVGVVYMIFGTVLATFLSSLASTGRGSTGAPPGAAIVGLMGVLGISVALIYPVMFAIYALISPFVAGGVYHLTLAIFQGTTKSYSHTVRVVGYSHAAYFWLFFPVPILSYFAWMIFTLISLVTGIDETHRCGVGKAILAIVAIPLVCCLCWCGLQGTIAAIGASATP